MKNLLKAGGLTIAVMSLSACATITRGTSQAFVVESEPVGADVTMSNGLACKTPCSLKVKRKDGFVVKINKDGYQPVEATIQSQMSGAGGAALAGNVILGGLIGAGVDAASGATKELKPNPLRVTLIPLTQSSVQAVPAATTEVAPTAEPVAVDAAVPAAEPAPTAEAEPVAAPAPGAE